MPISHDRVRDTRQRDWGWFNYSLLDLYGPRIKADGIAVYVALVRHADNATQTCHPSYETLAGETGLSRRQVMRVIERLVSVGLIRVSHQPSTTPEGKKVYAANRYTLLALEPVADVAPARSAVVTASHQGGDSQSPGGDTVTPGVVTASHQGGDSQSPKQDSTDKTHSGQEGEILLGEETAPALEPDGDGGAAWPVVHTLDKATLTGPRYLAFAQAAVQLPGVRVNGAWLSAEFDAYRDSVADRGKRSADWGAGWRAWLRRVQQFEPARGAARASPGPVPLAPSAERAEIARRRAKEARTA